MGSQGTGPGTAADKLIVQKTYKRPCRRTGRYFQYSAHGFTHNNLMSDLMKKPVDLFPVESHHDLAIDIQNRDTHLMRFSYHLLRFLLIDSHIIIGEFHLSLFQIILNQITVSAGRC